MAARKKATTKKTAKKTPAKRGRPVGSAKITPELTRRLVRSLERGNFIETACNINGIPRRTFSYWLKQGREAKSGQYKAFYEAMVVAEAKAEDLLLKRLDKAAGEDNWQAYAWRLERRWPHKWGRRIRAEETIRAEDQSIEAASGEKPGKERTVIVYSPDNGMGPKR